MRDKVIEGTSNGYSIGHAPLLDLSTSIPVRLLEIGEKEFTKFNALQNNTMSYGVIPGKTYKGQDTDVRTWEGYSVVFTHKDADEQTIYEITKAFWKNLDEAKTIDAGSSSFHPRRPWEADPMFRCIPVHRDTSRKLVC